MTKYELHAEYALALQDSVTQTAAIDFLAHKREHLPHSWPALAAVADEWTRMQLLAQTLTTNYKEQARVGARNDPGGYAFWLQRQAPAFLAQQHQWLAALQIAPSAQTLPDLALLPAGSFAIHCPFRLTSPYLSKDDAALHLLDNPVRREWVFKLPYVAASQWKGALRHALWQLGRQDDDEQIRRLFGLANDNEENGDRGRLYGYPTFFDRLSLEVINPHKRESGAGSLPIYFEAVPAGASGSFTLLYVPFDRIGEDEPETRDQVAADLQLVAQGVQALFTLYGFGAKTSSGFGLAADRLAGEGRLLLNVPDGAASRLPRPLEPPPPDQPPALRAYLAEFPSENFTLKPDEWRKQRNASNRQREAYMAARAANRDYQQALAQHQQDLARYQAELHAWQSANAQPPPATTERTFATFAELANQASKGALTLQQSRGGNG